MTLSKPATVTYLPPTASISSRVASPIHRNLPIDMPPRRSFVRSIAGVSKISPVRDLPIKRPMLTKSFLSGVQPFSPLTADTSLNVAKTPKIVDYKPVVPVSVNDSNLQRANSPMRLSGPRLYHQRTSFLKERSVAANYVSDFAKTPKIE